MYPNVNRYIAEHRVKLADVCGALDLTYQGLKNKLTGKHDFKASEIALLARMWGVTTDWLLEEGGDDV